MLSKLDQQIYIKNREVLLEQLQELQADFEDLSNKEIIDCRECVLERINLCLKAVLESDEDNID